MTIMMTVLATIAWLTTWLLIGYRLQQRLQGNSPLYRNVLIGTWFAALVLHGITILHHLSPLIALNFTTASSIVMWLSTLILFVTTLHRPLESLGLFILPFTLLSLLLPLTESGNVGLIDLTNGLGIHILSSLMAYSILTLAAIQAIVLAWQNQHLHNHKPTGFIRTLPPLLDMEALLFKFILVGVLLLTIGLISGLLFVNNLFGQHLVHKTVLSIIAWLVFSSLLVGHWHIGWRGRKAIRWTLSGFFLLMMAFFGSKFVLEYLITTP